MLVNNEFSKQDLAPFIKNGHFRNKNRQIYQIRQETGLEVKK